MVNLYTVVPCYNEEAVLPETASRLADKYRSLMESGVIGRESRIVFVNDGSKDKTWPLIQQLHGQDPLFSGINLSRNRGHQNALLAGLMTVYPYADAVVSLDADLQDDIDVIDKMIEQFEDGADVVYGVRSSRSRDSFFKRFTGEGFYKLINALGGEVVFNHADYRLLSRRALESLSEFGEVNLFLRGMVPMLGYKSALVYYERQERFAGESKYPLRKMLSFAFEGITSLSTRPIRFISLLGFFIFCVSVFMLLWIFIRHFTGDTVSGWTSTVISVWALGGLQLLAIGVVGEYIGKVYLEAKKRPRYLVESFLHDPGGALPDGGQAQADAKTS